MSNKETAKVKVTIDGQPLEIPPGDDHDLVVLPKSDDSVLERHDYNTSGAKEMIFMNFFSLSSRATGPKTRVPIGSP